MLEQNTLGYAKLKLNLDLPDLDENWLDGYESAQHNIAEEANPFLASSTEYQQWNEGWWAGFFNEERLFDWNDSSDTSIDTIINRIQQAAAIEKFTASPKLSRIQVFMSHLIQVTAAILAFGICYQFADLLA